MSFNRDPLKQTKAVIFSRKHNKTNHPVMLFNNNLLQESSSQKQLGIVLDHKINFEKHLRTMPSKVNKTIDLIRKLREILPRQSILTIYKTFTGSHLDYEEFIFNQSYNVSFHQKL